MELNGQRLNLNMQGIEEIALIDTFLIGFDYEGIEKFLKVYNANTHKYLGRLIDRGRGPNELISILSQNQYFKDASGCHLWIADEARFSKSYCINISKSLASGSTVCDTSFVLKNNPAPYKFHINDSIIIGFNYQNPEGVEYIRYNSIQRKIVSRRNLFDEKFYDDKHRKVFSFNISNIKPNSLDKVVGCSGFLNTIHIIDLDFEKSVTVEIEELKQPLTNILNNDKKIYTYKNVKVTNDYIYALYVNKTMAAMRSEETTIGVEVHVFKWDGSPVSKIKLKENIWQISVDGENKTLYGYSPLENLYEYDLSYVLP